MSVGAVEECCVGIGNEKICFIPFGAMFFSQMQNVYMYYINPSVHIHPGIYTHSKSKTTFIKGDLLYPFYIPSSVDLFLNTLRYCPSQFIH